jgi:hypothetical protein
MLHTIFSKHVIEINVGRGAKSRQAKGFEGAFNSETIQKAFSNDIKGVLRSKNSRVLIEKLKKEVMSKSKAGIKKQIKLGDFVKTRLKQRNLELYNNNQQLVDDLALKLNSLK